MQHQIILTEDQFYADFKPIKNHLRPNAAFEGCLFDISNLELEFVCEQAMQNELNVWTVVDADGKLTITNGYQYVNRIGYLITELPAQADTFYTIEDKDEPVEAIDPAAVETVASIMKQDLLDHDYDTPEQVPEWSWVEQNASYGNVRNGREGVWEFALNMSKDFTDAPGTLDQIIQEAKSKGIAYLIIHQGT